MNLRKSVLTLSLLALTQVACSSTENESISSVNSLSVPENITTPNIVRTQAVGDLNFTDGYPSDETMSKVQRYMFVQRAVNAFVDGIPISSMHAMLEGGKSLGGKANQSVLISESLIDKNSLWLTPNSTTPYISIEVDVKNGPVVLDINSAVLGLVDDAFFKYVGDIGLGNPKDKGKGGKYLLVHDSFEGEIPSGFIVLKTPTYRNWVPMRLNSTKDVKQFKDTFKMHPLGQEPKMDFIDFSSVKYNTIHANNEDFYRELNAVIQYEPITAGDSHYRGLIAEIGIEKGKEFNPQGEQLAALKEAAGIANVHARNEAFRPTNKDVYFYGDDRNWFLPFGSTMSHEFTKDGKVFIDDKTAFHYIATGITPLMTAQFDGAGSSYLVTTQDEKGAALDGNETYTITLPPTPPMKRFWSFMVYDNQTRSILPTEQRSGGFDSTGEVAKNQDGSVTVTFSPTKPEGKVNWVQTLSNKGFFVMFRMYSPTQEWHDRKYMIGDLIKQ
ncbi:DUF1254 domain-containing protein [Thalassotalea psychrophila]|uniref:DUF1254 domain-containing protein n=1 Tax=Thalassotalea psychrophila TaxID=3065647 RepID=A0ABY9TRI6_9GAMM|nr:DUF1254 domain-containing protein [Colwelliaceae bacterium SQ149]